MIFITFCMYLQKKNKLLMDKVIIKKINFLRVIK